MNARFIRWFDVISFAVDKPMSLTRKDLPLVIRHAFPGGKWMQASALDTLLITTLNLIKRNDFILLPKDEQS